LSLNPESEVWLSLLFKLAFILDIELFMPLASLYPLLEAIVLKTTSLLLLAESFTIFDVTLNETS